MFCSNCGKQVSDTSTFCIFCGNQIQAKGQYNTEIYKSKNES